MYITSILKDLNFKNILLLSVFIIFLFLNTLQANPFVGGDSKSSPPPPVISGKTGSFANVQFKYRDKIAVLLREMKSGSSVKLIMFLIGASFLYGLFHAAGPGHRKTIIFSLFLTKNARFYEPAAAGFLSAGIHAGTSLAIIYIIWIIQKKIASLTVTARIYSYMEGFTFLLLALLSMAFIFIKIISLFSGKSEIQKNTDGKKLYSMIIVTSLVPCPGVTMLLLFSIYLDLINAGIIGVISMSIGMGVIVSTAGYIAFAGRENLFLLLKRKEKILAKSSALLEIFSFVLILLFSVYMALPFILTFI